MVDPDRGLRGDVHAAAGRDDRHRRPPTIQSALHASFSDVQWVLDAYALTLASLLLTSGVLADRYGRRRLFAIGLVVFTLGSLLCGLAQDPLMLIASRSAQGIGGAIMFATSLALLGQSFRGKDRGVAFGVWGAVTGVAVAGADTRRRDHHHDQLARHLPGECADRRGASPSPGGESMSPVPRTPAGPIGSGLCC